MPTCAFVDCAEVTSCCLVGGCVRQRFGRGPASTVRLVAPTVDELPKNARSGLTPKPRASRDPWFIKRRRKALF